MILAGERTVMKDRNILYTDDRRAWRAWLAANFDTEREVWLAFPKKNSGEDGIQYNDAVEEALCFGWIDSTVRKLDEYRRIQRFSPRRKGSAYSRANIERLIWLDSQGLLHPRIAEAVRTLIREPYVFPEDILAAIRSDSQAWAHYENFSAVYKRIRVAYIDGARNRPDEFGRRLASFIRRTRENKLLGYGGIDKYYDLDQAMPHEPDPGSGSGRIGKE